MTDNDIRVKSSQLRLKLSKHLLFILTHNEISISGRSSELFEEKGASSSTVFIWLRFDKVILTEEVTNCIDVKVLNLVCIEESFQLDLRGHDRFERNTHDSHLGGVGFVIILFQELRILKESA